MDIDLAEPKLCSLPARYKYTWPGQLEKRVCVVHAIQAENLAQELGFNLQVIRLTIAEMFENDQCTQEEKG